MCRGLYCKLAFQCVGATGCEGEYVVSLGKVGSLVKVYLRVYLIMSVCALCV